MSTPGILKTLKKEHGSWCFWAVRVHHGGDTGRWINTGRMFSTRHGHGMVRVRLLATSATMLWVRQGFSFVQLECSRERVQTVCTRVFRQADSHMAFDHFGTTTKDATPSVALPKSSKPRANRSAVPSKMLTLTRSALVQVWAISTLLARSVGTSQQTLVSVFCGSCNRDVRSLGSSVVSWSAQCSFLVGVGTRRFSSLPLARIALRLCS